MASAQEGSFFLAPTEPRILSQLQCGVAIDQIIKSWVFCFSIVYCFNLFIYWEILYSSLRTCFPLLILGSLCMPKIISTILKKVFWIIKGEIILVHLPVKLLCVLVFSLALTSLSVHSSTFVLTFRKELPNLSFCKFLVLFHNCYYYYCWILNFSIHSPPHFKNNSMDIFKRCTIIIINLLYYFSGSVDTIVFCKTGNDLPQCLWFSNSFFTVHGCIDYVEGILNS